MAEADEQIMCPLGHAGGEGRPPLVGCLSSVFYVSKCVSLQTSPRYVCSCVVRSRSYNCVGSIVIQPDEQNTEVLIVFMQHECMHFFTLIMVK